jgi:hypothetical protein
MDSSPAAASRGPGLPPAGKAGTDGIAGLSFIDKRPDFLLICRFFQPENCKLADYRKKMLETEPRFWYIEKGKEADFYCLSEPKAKHPGSELTIRM